MQEAERFAVIDSAWVELMKRAREKINVIKCCAADDQMSKELPHLLEELEACQKSLVGYVLYFFLLFSYGSEFLYLLNLVISKVLLPQIEKA